MGGRRGQNKIFSWKSACYTMNFHKYKNVQEINKEIIKSTRNLKKNLFKPNFPRDQWTFFKEDKCLCKARELFNICKKKESSVRQ